MHLFLQLNFFKHIFSTFIDDSRDKREIVRQEQES